MRAAAPFRAAHDMTTIGYPGKGMAHGNTAARSATGRLWYPYLLIAPTMITLVVVSLIPFLYVLFLSLHDVRYGQVRDFAWLANYETLLTDPRFWNSMFVATIFVLIAVPLEFMLGLTGALILNRGIRLRRIVVPFLFIPTMMASIVVGLLWKIMLAGSWGLISYNLLERFGFFTDASIFASPNAALYALILVDVWQWTPFMMLAFFAGLQSLPVNPYHAAAVDGADPVQTFFRLTLPMLSPVLAVIGLLRLIDAFKIFDTIFLLTGGGPGTVTESPSILAYELVFEYWKVGEASALAVLVWIAFFLFCSIFYHIARKRLNAF
jgi:multiple sugar transport system permease protein